MKLSTHVFPEVLNQTISALLAQATNKVSQPNQSTSQNSIKWDNFWKNCPILLKFGMQVRFTTQYPPEEFR